jgi:cobyrinic acid a,c-diamide synthase
MLRRALSAADITVLGAVPRDAALALPSRHLGLVQAREHAALTDFIIHAAEMVARHVDLTALKRAATAPSAPSLEGEGKGGGYQARVSADASLYAIPPLGQRIAVARDDAFAFCYPHVLEGWRRAGAEIDFFSPLADQAPPTDCNAVYLPGGYPELHAGGLAAASRFMRGLRNAATRGAIIHGECGGYMTLGEGLIDANGARHAMVGLLPLETSFAARKLHLGYRAVELIADGALGPKGTRFKGHEFHYATIVSEGDGEVLFDAHDATGASLGLIGRRAGAVFGSFAHLIDRTGR